MADEKYNTYEIFLNSSIKKFKDMGLRDLAYSLKHTGNILTVKTIKGEGDYVNTDFANFSTGPDQGGLRTAPQSAAVSIKSQYNYLKKKLISATDADIMDAAVNRLFEKQKRGYDLWAHDKSMETSSIKYYYSAKVMREFLTESVSSLGDLPCFEKIDSFLSKESAHIEYLKKKDRDFWLIGERGEANDEMLKFAGGAIGLGIVLIIVVGFIKIVSGVVGNSSYSGSGYNSQSSGGSMTINGESYTKQQFEDKLRGEAERLYDNCQALGSGFSDKCP